MALGLDIPPFKQSADGHSQGSTTSTIQAKIFTFDELHYGDCQLDSGKLVLQSDGIGIFECTTLTYHTNNGDYWRFCFQIYDATGKLLFQTDDMSGPRMVDGNPPPKYPWVQRFLFSSDEFLAINKAVHRFSA